MRRLPDEALDLVSDAWRLSPTATGVLRRDTAWQQRARLLQVAWARTNVSAPMRTDYPWRIADSPMAPYAGDANFLTEPIALEVARALGPACAEPLRVIEPRRLRTNLLSSQPLCFNAFGELSLPGREDLAAAVLSRLWPDLVGRVRSIRYEHNPHRGPDGLTGTQAAFDVFVDADTPTGERTFVAIEVKYHEDMRGPAPRKVARRAEVDVLRRTALERAAGWVGCDLDDLMVTPSRSSPVWQIWMDHSLALSLLRDDVWSAHWEHECFPTYRQGVFVMLSPARNDAVQQSFTRYRTLIADTTNLADSLRFCSLEELIAACRAALPGEPWVDRLHHRYTDTSSLEATLGLAAQETAR